MKTNGKIDDLRAIRCFNDNEYCYKVVGPLLAYLGVPAEMCRMQFPIENPFGSGHLRLDFLIHVGEIPMVTVEGEPRANQFDEGYKQARDYSTNFRPRQKGCVIREMTVPFLIVAAGERVEMLRAVAKGLNIEYEQIAQDGRPAFLEWHELQAEAERIGGPVEETQPVLKADAARQFFDDLYRAIDSSAALREKDDQKIMLFNRIIDLARQNRKHLIERECAKVGVGKLAVKKVVREIDIYEQKVVRNEFSGAAVARGYRNFLVQPSGHGGHLYFTGESQHRPYREGKRIRYRNVARYFTPTEVVQQMVRLAAPHSTERVIDLTCGSGIFLAECVDFIAQAEGETKARKFLTKRLVGTDDDPFCVSCSRSLLTFLYPQYANELLVFLHNCLYDKTPKPSEIAEDQAAEPHLRAGEYDLVIGNPPGNDEYSGTNPDYVAQLWAERFGHDAGGLMDHHCFIRRAIELAKPNGGRICLLVPEGLLSRDNRGVPQLRHEILRECELRAIISLPRVFKNNHAQMAVLYLARNTRWNAEHKVLMASVRPTWVDDKGEAQQTNLFAELEMIVDHYAAVAEQNRQLPDGEGLAGIPSASIVEPTRSGESLE
jgi:N-6 DNA Methylase